MCDKLLSNQECGELAIYHSGGINDIEAARYQVYSELRMYHYREIPSRFKILIPRGSFDRWVQECYLLHPDRPDPLIPTRDTTSSTVLLREILDDLPIKISRFPKDVQEAKSILRELVIATRELLIKNGTKCNLSLDSAAESYCIPGIEYYLNLSPRERNLSVIKQAISDFRERTRPFIEQIFKEKIDKYSADLLSKATLFPKYVPTVTLFLSRSMLSIDDKYISISREVISKLHARYLGSDDTFTSDLQNLLLRYIAYIGDEVPNMHASLPRETFDILQNEFGVTMELFSSPFNTTLDKYLSVFPDTDVVFGSSGSFFDFNIHPGSYEANPPFIEEVIIAFVDKIHIYLDIHALPMSFVIFVPCWDDSEGIRRIKESPYLRLLTRLEPQKHIYSKVSISGKSKFITAPNATYVAFIQNDAGYEKWTPRAESVKLLKSSMARNARTH